MITTMVISIIIVGMDIGMVIVTSMNIRAKMKIKMSPLTNKL